MQDPERDDTELAHRWRWAQVHVRCGLAADGPSCVHVYLQLGIRLASRGTQPAFKVHLRMLRTLLLTAQDEALPADWRTMCLEQATVPLAHLASSVGLHDPIAMQALEAAVQRARDRLPRAQAAPRPGLPSL